VFTWFTTWTSILSPNVKKLLVIINDNYLVLCGVWTGLCSLDKCQFIQMAAIQFVCQISTRSIRNGCLCEILTLQSPLENKELICRPVCKHENIKLALFSSFPKRKTKANTRTWHNMYDVLWRNTHSASSRSRDTPTGGSKLLQGVSKYIEICTASISR